MVEAVKKKSPLRMFAGQKNTRATQRGHPGKGEEGPCHSLKGGVSPLIFGKLCWKRLVRVPKRNIIFPIKMQKQTFFIKHIGLSTGK